MLGAFHDDNLPNNDELFDDNGPHSYMDMTERFMQRSMSQSLSPEHVLCFIFLFLNAYELDRHIFFVE